MKIPDHILPDGWQQDRFGQPICPHGNKMEKDGKGPCGCKSPLREKGLI